MIILPAEIGCEVGLNEGKNGVTHLVSKHPGPDSWMWGARGWIVNDGGGGEERKSDSEVELIVTRCAVCRIWSIILDLPLLLFGSVPVLVYPLFTSS